LRTIWKSFSSAWRAFNTCVQSLSRIPAEKNVIDNTGRQKLDRVILILIFPVIVKEFQKINNKTLKRDLFTWNINMKQVRELMA
jgi:type II secretory pathway component GspD/PulD (secretin)